MTVNIAPYLMAITGEAERRHAFAILQAAIPATAFLGSVIAGLLPGFFATQMGLSLDMPGPYRLALWLGPFLCVLSILPLRGADPGRIMVAAETTVSREPAPLLLLLFYGTVIFFQAVGEGAARSFFNVYLDDGPGRAAGPNRRHHGHGTVAADCRGADSYLADPEEAGYRIHAGDGRARHQSLSPAVGGRGAAVDRLGVVHGHHRHDDADGGIA